MAERIVKALNTKLFDAVLWLWNMGYYGSQAVHNNGFAAVLEKECVKRELVSRDALVHPSLVYVLFVARLVDSRVVEQSLHFNDGKGTWYEFISQPLLPFQSHRNST
ncbi:uncharacterized protein ARMOST_02175 [Armillaria ostoyae]|uniref:Uncharacterized protein n=1 Tax=Armillaria ostoyae TaxID=47428 RepID=A0A284QQZ5_ARMOS|nr:uncharacterized protein ARMOST_02175 [Armillaria ostoyae]